MMMYLEAAAHHGLEVRDFTDDSLVRLPLAVSTNDCEI